MCSYSRQMVIQLLLLLVAIAKVMEVVAGDTDSSTNLVSAIPTSPWLKKATNSRPTGCWFRPWICSSGQGLEKRMLCCNNRCVDTMTDLNNCGFCGIKCLFGWQCCNGFCVDTNLNPFHCGKCGNRCPFGSPCIYGLCGYAQPILPPFLLPFPPNPPLSSASKLRSPPSPPKHHLPATP